MPVVTAAVAVFVERKVPSKTEATALLLLVSGVVISVFEGQASGSSYGITLSVTGKLNHLTISIVVQPSNSHITALLVFALLLVMGVVISLPRGLASRIAVRP